MEVELNAPPRCCPPNTRCAHSSHGGGLSLSSDELQAAGAAAPLEAAGQAALPSLSVESKLSWRTAGETGRAEGALRSLLLLLPLLAALQKGEAAGARCGGGVAHLGRTTASASSSSALLLWRCISPAAACGGAVLPAAIGQPQVLQCSTGLQSARANALPSSKHLNLHKLISRAQPCKGPNPRSGLAAHSMRRTVGKTVSKSSALAPSPCLFTVPQRSPNPSLC